MAKAKEVTTKFRVDLTDFKKGITEANQQIKVANAQFKAATSGMDDWSKSSTGLEAKIKQLNDTLEAEKNKLKTLEKQQQATKEAEQEAGKAKDELKKKINSLQKEYDDLVKAQGENSKEALELKKSLTELNKEYSNAEKAQTRNAKAVKDLDIKILNQQATINKTDKELKNYKKSLTDLNASNNKVKSSFEKLEDTINEQENELKSLKTEYSNVVLEQGKNSKEARKLVKEMASLNKKLNDSKSEMNNVEKSADDLTSSLKDIDSAASSTGDGFTILKGTLADLGSSVIQGTVSKIGDLVSSLFELNEATKEYRQMSAKLEGSANTFGYSVEFANDKYKEFYRYLGDDQMSTNAVTNLMGLGTSTESVSKLAEGAISVWSAYGDSIPIESLTESINETAQVGKVTGSLADALNWAGISEDEFNKKLEKTKSTQERADLIANTLNKTYGDSKKTYDEMTGSIQEANEAEIELKDTQAKVAEDLAPLTNKFTELKTQGLEALQPVIQTVSEKFLEFIDWAIENIPKIKEELDKWEPVIVAVGTAIGTYFVATKILGFIDAIRNGTLVLKLMSAAQAALNLVMSMNPIGLVVAAIAGLVAAFVVLWKKSETFRQFWIDLWENIKTAIGVAKEWIGEKIDEISKFFTETVPEFIDKAVGFFKELPSKIWTWLVNTVQKVLEWRSNMISKAKETASNFVTTVINYVKSLPSKIWNAIVGAVSRVAEWGSNLIATGKEKISSFVSSIFDKARELPSKIYNGISGAIGKVKQWGSDMVSSGKTAIGNFVDKVVGWIKDMPSKIGDVGKNMVSGIWDGIKNKTDWLKGKIKEWVGKPVKWAKEFLGIKSPSRVFRDEIGKYMAEGVGVGFEVGMEDVKKDINKALTFTKDSLSIPSLNLNGVNYNGGYASNSGMQGNNQTINFYQTNNSPKSLSRLEIYRQTNNALNRVKGGFNYV